ncbi:MAG TPA: sulfite exporter TauE/SafE family protein [Gemmatimonadaceae bacterium]|nr:sulfite exporter TauE/SafE family protein [Gemmatimonadaceae bacterium]
MTWFLIVLFLVAMFSGAAAAVVGFGIGSLLTPLLAWRVGMPTAIAAVAIPHALATGFRFWRLRRAVAWDVVRTFGVLSAVGGLGGALLYTRLGGRSLALALATLLILTGLSGLTRLSMRWHPHRLAGFLGLVSGFFGGLAGNQGGLRSAALLAFRLPPARFVATATATALLVDAARTPVYLWRAGPVLLELWLPLLVSSVAVLGGTLLGERILLGMTMEQFRQVVSLAILLLGMLLVARAW